MNQEEAAAILGQKMRETVLNQLESGDPAIVTATYTRLQSEGVADDEAIRMMAQCMMLITLDIMQGEAEWDLDRYTEMLEALPDEQVIYEL